MKAKRREIRTEDKKPVRVARPRRIWPWALSFFLAAFLVFEVYGPVLRGPFLFDDDYLAFRRPGFTDQLGAWMAGVRPLLMFTYWVNFRLSPVDTFLYHVVNVVFHLGAGVLMFFILRRLLELAGTRGDRVWILSAFGAGLFLLHPIQTESVAYVASRSENLSVMLMLGAFAAFVCRPVAAISWGRAAAVLVLFGAALASKEHTLMLPALLLLTDYYWNPGFSLQGIRRNWRLYLPLAAAAAVGVAFVMRVLAHADTAGFGMKNLKWYEYFFTQGRALFVYLRLFVLPYGQTVDYDFPISRTPWQHGAFLGLAALVAITVAAWLYRRRWPLASFGWLTFLILMAPTSSVMPIADPVAERRLYISMIGLLLIAFEFLRRLNVDRKMLAGALAGVLVVAAVLTWQRNQVWTDNMALWRDAVEKFPGKSRAHFQLAYAYYSQNRCAEALPHYRRVAEIDGPAYDSLVDWALALDCNNQPQEALAKLKQAAALDSTAHVYSLIGMVFAKQSRWAEALAALDTASRINPAYAMTFVYRGDVRLSLNDPAAAIAEYRRALELDPRNEIVGQKLIQAEQRARVR
ncbi:MAG TPA: tetratricopeptide repeat protein [Bryobacteraceae bacterium]|nr:tetratricopeptide repeat protein [Bryobacteraceae bacterium]